MYRTSCFLLVAICSLVSVALALEASSSSGSSPFPVVVPPPSHVSLSSCRGENCMSADDSQRFLPESSYPKLDGALKSAFKDSRFLPLSKSLMPKKYESEALASGSNATTFVARSGLSSFAIVALNATMTNATFESMICSSLAVDTVVLAVTANLGLLPRFLLPDCFYALSATSLYQISLSNVILQGNTTFPDPFDRLSRLLNGPGVSFITFQNVAFLPYDTSSYRPNWDQIWTDFPSLVTLRFEKCNLYGSLPTVIPNTLTTFALPGNHLSGTIPLSLFENYTSTAASMLTWSFSSNELTGTIPSGLITNLPDYSQITLAFDYNQLSGTIPSNFLTLTRSSTLKYLSLSFGNNLFVDTIPNDLWGLPLSLPSLTAIFIDTTGLSISGTIPSAWINQYSFPNLAYLALTMPRCNLTGAVGTGMLPMSSSMIVSVGLFLDSNPLNSPISSNFFDTVVNGLNYSPTGQTSSFVFSNCGITGSVSLPSPMNSTMLIQLFMDSNSLTAFSASNGSIRYLQVLDLSHNTALQGSVENLFSSSYLSTLRSLDLSYTSIGGNMPDMAQMRVGDLGKMRLDATAIDFCFNETNRSPWSPSLLNNCSLRSTSASQCSHLYPSICDTSLMPSLPVVAPTFAPAAVPPATTPTAPQGCPGTPPTPEFVCVNGVWTFTGTVTAPTIVISPGTSEVVVSGNVTSGTVVLQGIGSSITVTGCFTNLSVVTIQLTPEDLKKLGSHSVIELLRSDGNCSDYSTVAVGTTVTRSSCRTVKVDKATTSNGSLNGVFSVSSSGCNLWWIILVSVLAVLVIGGMIALTVILHVRKQNSISTAKSVLHG